MGSFFLYSGISRRPYGRIMGPWCTSLGAAAPPNTVTYHTLAPPLSWRHCSLIPSEARVSMSITAASIGSLYGSLYFATVISGILYGGVYANVSVMGLILLWIVIDPSIVQILLLCPVRPTYLVSLSCAPCLFAAIEPLWMRSFVSGSIKTVWPNLTSFWGGHFVVWPFLL